MPVPNYIDRKAADRISITRQSPPVADPAPAGASDQVEISVDAYDPQTGEQIEDTVIVTSPARLIHEIDQHQKVLDEQTAIVVNLEALLVDVEAALVD